MNVRILITSLSRVIVNNIIFHKSFQLFLCPHGRRNTALGAGPVSDFSKVPAPSQNHIKKINLMHNKVSFESHKRIRVYNFERQIVNQVFKLINYGLLSYTK